MTFRRFSSLVFPACAFILAMSGLLAAQNLPSVVSLARLPPEPLGFGEPVLSSLQQMESYPVTDLPSLHENRYTLDELEAMAFAANPALAEALERIEAVRGRSWQAGLGPNPTVGYVANEVGNDGSPGQHGVYFGRTIVRGGKLEWSRQVECQEVMRLREQYNVIRQRVQTDVRTNYYAVYWLQQRIDLLNRFQETSQRTMEIARRLFKSEETNKSDVLLVEIEYEQVAADLVGLQADLDGAWREFASVIGDMQLPPARLLPPESLVPQLTWDEALGWMQQSPRLAAAQAAVERERAARQRAIVEPIPNLSTQVSIQYDFATDDVFTGVQVGMPVPKWNRNQGGIYEAHADLRAAIQQVERTRLAIQRQLAKTFGKYQNAKNQLEQIETLIVPKAEEVVKIILTAYDAGEATIADVLNAQRSLLRANLRFQETRRDLRLAHASIAGFLLHDGLEEAQ